MDIGLKREVILEFRGDGIVFNLIVCVVVYIVVGDGLWSFFVFLEFWRLGNFKVMFSFF